MARKQNKPPQLSSYGKQVTLQTYGEDKYGRTLAEAFLSDGTNVNHLLV